MIGVYEHDMIMIWMTQMWTWYELYVWQDEHEYEMTSMFDRYEMNEICLHIWKDEHDKCCMIRRKK